MVVDKLENLEKYIPFKYKQEILEWVSTVNQDIPEGEYSIVGEDIFARVLSYKTKKETDCKIEAHNKYIDIQSTICGVEGIQVYQRELLEFDKEYDSDKDVAFYKVSHEPYLKVNVEESCFALLFPKEAHQPEISFQGDCPKIKKFVIKIKEELYE